MITAIIQARMGSTRLPGKTMRLLAGKPILQHVVERVQQCPVVTQVIVATTDKPEDGQILEWCNQHDIQALGVNRLLSDGRNDVLYRYAVCAEMAKNDRLMRVTADCPLWRPDLGLEVAQALTTDYGIASNVHPDLDGFDTEVFWRGSLLLANQQATDLHDRQHVTPWMYRELNKIRVDHLKEVGGQKLSVDTEEDFQRARNVLEGGI